jgi:hypothetical protein
MDSMAVIASPDKSGRGDLFSAFTGDCFVIPNVRDSCNDKGLNTGQRDNL